MGLQRHSDYEQCTLCPSIRHYFRDDFDYTPQSVAAANRELFHSQCRQCDDAEHHDDPQLCDWCAHLRPRHVLMCYSQTAVLGDVWGISLDPFLEKSLDCDFCRFLATRYRERFPDISLEEEFDEHGGFALAFPLHRSISERTKRDEIQKRHTHDYTFGNHPNYVRFNVNNALSSALSSDAYALASRHEGFVHGLNWPLMRRYLTGKPQATEDGAGVKSTVSTHLNDVRVIDVDHDCVIRLPAAAEYAALSYVWGEHHSGQVELTKASKSDWERTGALSQVRLPNTVSDAIVACRRLGYSYLWIDRLNIIQDDTPERKSVQLDQMAYIYQQATVTLVALAGESASYGLPGVTQPKTFQQNVFAFSDFSLVEGVPDFFHLVIKSTWHTRGWYVERVIWSPFRSFTDILRTFQESEASVRQLYFTDHGVYFINHASGGNGVVRIDQESTAEHTIEPHPPGIRMGTYAKMVEYYTQKALSFPNDILRAFSGTLNSFYNSRTAFGLPWGDFDRAILWYVEAPNPMLPPSTEADTFPSWSWSSVSGSKQFHQLSPYAYGLAYWGHVSHADALSSSAPYVEVARPSEAELELFGRQSIYGDTPSSDQARVMAGLAWQAGCLRTRVPKELIADCSKEQYAERLTTRWPTYTSYWEDALGSYDTSNMFPAPDVHLGVRPGRLMVHAQRASFRLEHSKHLEETYPSDARVGDGTTAWGYDKCNIRSIDGRLVGAVHFDVHDTLRLVSAQGGIADFIALSISPQRKGSYETEINEGFGWSFNDIFNCPCRYTIEQIYPEIKISAGEPGVEHFEECYNHPEFSTPLPYLPELKNKHDSSPPDDHTIALSKHFAGVSYFGVSGGLMHDWWGPPALRVMMIVPSNGRGKGQRVYERAGLGRIYLKRWVEADPKFETVVLE
jgi:hypothetical protein